ncbi:hypothetical protein MRB53_020924 [Persea americana]|uniref:Uncharacterized protein n=1 Tax=Persea americana TaxID=3435 RepID=A0ACC2L3F3_PERAE|nr:hypothetical protein MRB53_020924 [Persea americana]|eukprot:TRINITY_DN12807_c0_g1_i1.p1 TRINITY_DN12807_c0_g1~~TRINITY_DN12807_c0_g1_i1.p1  ORF type:complete len:216 (-),score=25.49 TRINITY_DN12807_c0_g1_i1:609-1256(-)
MALGGVVSFLACSLLFLHPIAATEVALPPILAPILNGTCDGIYCGKGTCKANPNGTFLFSCECDAGWKQSSIEDSSFKFMPCVIPNCTLNFSCIKDTAPAPAPPLSPANHSIFDPCTWAYCGQGTCVKTENFRHRCECKEGYVNLLNVTTFPCFNQCVLGQDCSQLGVGLTNTSSSPAPSLSDSGRSVNSACSGLSRNLLQLIILGISLAMVPWL